MRNFRRNRIYTLQYGARSTHLLRRNENALAHLDYDCLERE
jgi:hypothetical protein